MHQAAARLARRARVQGLSTRACAELLGTSPRSLTRWWADRAKEPRPRGRPPRRLTPTEVRAVRAWLRGAGPHAGLERLQQAFPEVARQALRRRLNRFRLA